jgi:hypothetical protein
MGFSYKRAGLCARTERERPQVPETAAEQDATVQGLAKAELADLDAQPANIAEDEASNSTNEDY